MSPVRTALCVWLAILPVLAQTSGPAPKAEPQADTAALTKHLAYIQATETVRIQCIQNRRIICGKILKILPGGLIVDSGYTSLMRQPLDHSWLIPGTVDAQREPNLVEKNEPGCVCAGLVFVTDIPKSRRSKPKAKELDYVVLTAFPTGQFTYNSVGTVQRTVRRFSSNLPVAVKLNCEAAGIHPPLITMAPATNSPDK